MTEIKYHPKDKPPPEGWQDHATLDDTHHGEYSRLIEKVPYKRKEVIGDCVLYLGDCMEVMPTLGGVDACVTDPPYGIGIAANSFRQKHEKKEWDAKAPDLSFLPGIPSIIWGGNYFDLPSEQGFFIWDKVQPESFSSAQLEYAWNNLKMPAKLFRRHVVSYEKHHPTTKPLELMKWCLGFLPNAETILDPFMGSGTTLVACAKMGRKGIGIELEEKYFDIACERVEDAYRQPDMFVQAPEKKKEQDLLI